MTQKWLKVNFRHWSITLNNKMYKLLQCKSITCTAHYKAYTIDNKSINMQLKL